MRRKRGGRVIIQTCVASRICLSFICYLGYFRLAGYWNGFMVI